MNDCVVMDINICLRHPYFTKREQVVNLSKVREHRGEEWVLNNKIKGGFEISTFKQFAINKDGRALSLNYIQSVETTPDVPIQKAILKQTYKLLEHLDHVLVVLYYAEGRDNRVHAVANLRMNQAKGKYYMLILDPNNAASETKLAYNTKKGHYEGTKIDLDDKKVYNTNSSLKFLQRVELYTIVEEDVTRGSSKNPSRNHAKSLEAQLMKIMYGEESVAKERKKEGARVTNKRKKRSNLSDRKQRGWNARRKMMAEAHVRSERDEKAEEEEGGSHASVDQVEAEEDLMREHEDSE
jgi:hypothetical protein